MYFTVFKSLISFDLILSSQQLGMILTHPNEESTELYLHCNYHVAQNGSPPMGGKLLITAFS